MFFMKSLGAGFTISIITEFFRKLSLNAQNRAFDVKPKFNLSFCEKLSFIEVVKPALIVYVTYVFLEIFSFSIK